ncbi:MAG TPA: NYN domain-containing protein [Anaerolineales bacterium]|nr:NYN domain-containing protein [Anaerolineales bacterium]
MPYIIDGHNLIAALPDLDLSDLDDEKKLVEMLQGFCSRTERRATVYFDRGAPGGEPTIKSGRVHVKFVRLPRSADDAIRDHLRKLGKEAPNWTIVSSDREVRSAALRVGASVLHSGAFVQIILQGANTSNQSEKPQEILSDKDLDEWERLFRNRDKGSS